MKQFFVMFRVTISYFDLAEYGLEDYYRYEADSFEDGGRYNSDKIVEQPRHTLVYKNVGKILFA